MGKFATFYLTFMFPRNIFLNKELGPYPLLEAGNAHSVDFFCRLITKAEPETIFFNPILL